MRLNVYKKFLPIVLAVLAAVLVVVPSASASFGYVGGLNMFGGGSSGDLLQFEQPSALARTATGEFLIVDSSNDRIVKLSSTGQFVLEFGFPGTADGQFKFPTGVAVSPLNGDVWVADYQNNRVQRFDQSGGFLGKIGGTATGTGNGQFNGVGGITVSAAGTVYVSDTNNHRIQYFNASGTYLGQWGSSGSGDGQFNRPFGISTAENGDVYVVDRQNYRVQYFSSTGTFVGKFGCNCSGDGNFVAPWGVFVDQSTSPDQVYVTNDYFDHRIQRFTLVGGLLGKWGPEATLSPGSALGDLSTPQGIVVDSAGTAYVAEAGNGRIQRFDSVRTTPTAISTWGSAGTGDGQFRSPSGAAAAPDGSVYVADAANFRIQRLSAKNALLYKWGTPGSGTGQFGNIAAVAVAPSGDVYVLEASNAANDVDTGRVQRFSSTGTFEAQFSDIALGEKLSYPNDIAVDGAGNVWVTDGSSRRVIKFDADGVPLDAWGAQGNLPGQFQGVSGIVANDAGTEVFVTDSQLHNIRKYDADGVLLDESAANTFLGSAADGFFNQPQDLSVDPVSGDLFVVDSLNNRVQRFTTALDYVSKFGTVGRDLAQFNNPTDLSFDPGGYLWVADSSNDRVQRFGDVPVVTITSPAAGFVTTNSAITPAYTVSDFAADCTTLPAAPHADGPKNVEVTCTNLRGAGADSVAFTVDTTNPNVSIVSPLAGSTITTATTTLDYTASDALGTVDCDLADGSTLGPFPNGLQSVTVTCTDDAGNSASAVASFTVAVPSTPAGPPNPAVPVELPIELSLRKRVKASSKIKLTVVCPARCDIVASVKIGKRSTKLGKLSAPPGANPQSVALKIPKKLLTKIKAALDDKKSVTLSVTVSAPEYKATAGKSGKAKLSK
ncbi:MAG: SMP-30/gluconolactonase/LRE family protein [Solirubrobacterales bacterium]